MVPKVSVVILTRNRATLLPTAIYSVLNQTYADFELIVIDDASGDNTREVVGGMADARIRSIRHDVNRGEAESRNDGVTNSRGEYIAFLDDDDEWLPQKLRLQVDLLDGCPATVGGVYAGLIYVDSATGKVAGQRTPERRGYIYPSMADENVLGPLSSVLLRRRLFDEVGLFDVSIGYGTDYDMTIRLSMKFDFEFIREPLVKYSLHSGQMSQDYAFIAGGWENLMRKHASLFASNRKRFSERSLELSRLYWMSGMRRESWQARWKAMQLRPLGWKNYGSLCSLLAALLGAAARRSLTFRRTRLDRI